MEVIDGQKVAYQGYGFPWKRLQGLGHSRLEHKKAAPFPKLLSDKESRLLLICHIYILYINVSLTAVFI